MRRHAVALTVSFVDDGAEFVEGESWNRIENIVMNPSTAVGIDLDPIGTMRKLFPHCFARTLDPIYRFHSNRYWHVPGIGRLQGIRASYVHGTSHHLHARTPDQPVINSIAYVNISVAGALGFKIADCDKAPIQGGMRGSCCLNRPI